MAFPSDQFGGQAPCSSSCERAYAYHKVGAQSNFPVFDKVEVNGPTALETYTVLKHGSGLIEGGPPREPRSASPEPDAVISVSGANAPSWGV